MKNILENLNKKPIAAIVTIVVISLLVSGFSFFPNSNQYGKFVRVGNMHYARSGHEAVLLKTGKVLIVGGGYKQAEIYDPEKRKFYLTGSMDIKRKDFTATLLKNGKVLITGGKYRNRSLKSVELYNPETGIFEEGPEMNFSRVIILLLYCLTTGF